MSLPWKRAILGRDIAEPHQAAPEGGFAATGFAHKADRLAGQYLQRDIVDGMDDAPRPRRKAPADDEILADSNRLQQRRLALIGCAHDTPMPCRRAARQLPFRGRQETGGLMAIGALAPAVRHSGENDGGSAAPKAQPGGSASSDGGLPPMDFNRRSRAPSSGGIRSAAPSYKDARAI